MRGKADSRVMLRTVNYCMESEVDKSDIELWTRRAYRQRRRVRIATADLRRALSWHIGGGRRFFRRYGQELVAAHKWCFIVGCNNSGTSLLQKMLEQTGKVSALRSEGQVYTRVMTRADRRGHERVWSEYLSDLARSSQDDVSDVPRLVHDWMDALSPPIHETIVEKTPADAVRMEWLQKAFPRSYFVCLVRNGYVVCEGIRRKGHKPLVRGARHWARVNELILSQSRNIARLVVIRYEDLVEKPEDTMSMLLEFLEIEPPSQVQQNDGLSLLYKRVRNYNFDSIGRLSDEDKLVIFENARDMLERFGYSSTVRH